VQCGDGGGCAQPCAGFRKRVQLSGFFGGRIGRKCVFFRRRIRLVIRCRWLWGFDNGGCIQFGNDAVEAEGDDGGGCAKGVWGWDSRSIGGVCFFCLLFHILATGENESYDRHGLVCPCLMSNTEGGKQRGSYEKGVFRSVRKTVGFGIRCLACWLVLGLCVFIYLRLLQRRQGRLQRTLGTSSLCSSLEVAFLGCLHADGLLHLASTATVVEAWKFKCRFLISFIAVSLRSR